MTKKREPQPSRFMRAGKSIPSEIVDVSADKIAAMTKEHDFLVDREEWELNVFDAAIKEGNFASINIKTKERIEYPTFPAAMKALHKVSGQHMLYAVAKSGRFVMLPPRKWNDFARRYLAARAVGQVQG